MGDPLKRALVLHQKAESSLDFFVLAAIGRRGLQPYVLDTRSQLDLDFKRDLEGLQAVVLVRYWPEQRGWRRLLRELRAKGVRTIYVMDDDLFNPQAFAPLPAAYRAKLKRLACDRQRQITGWAQEIWVSTPHLAQRYAHLAPVLMPLQPQPRALQRRGHVLRLGYHGTESHQQELLWLLPLIERVQARFPNALVEIYGSEPWRQLYRHVPRVRVLAPLCWERYCEITGLEHLDLMLCPLLDHPFNAARAAVKFVDAARLGAVGLFSERPPFLGLVAHGEDGLLLADSHDDWFHAIEALAVNPRRRQLMALSAQAKAASMGLGNSG